jgi:Domain of unknown function DUF29
MANNAMSAAAGYRQGFYEQDSIAPKPLFGRTSRSWKVTIASQRAEIRQHLRDNPGLRSSIPLLLTDAYETTRIEVATRLAGQLQPPHSCPWSLEQIMDDCFRPE